MLAQQRFDRVEIVPRETVDVRVILLDQAAVAGGTPGVTAVIGTAGQEDLLAAGVFAGHLQRPGGHVRAVLAEDRPGGEVDERDEAFGEVDHDGGRMVEAIAQGALAFGGGLDLGVARAEDVGSVAAEEIEKFVVVDVPVAAALGAHRVVRRGQRQDSGRMRVAGDAAGNHAGGALEQGQGAGERAGHGDATIRRSGADVSRRCEWRRLGVCRPERERACGRESKAEFVRQARPNSPAVGRQPSICCRRPDGLPAAASQTRLSTAFAPHFAQDDGTYRKVEEPSTSNRVVRVERNPTALGSEWAAKSEITRPLQIRRVSSSDPHR